jgi:hypothetical protein
MADPTNQNDPTYANDPNYVFSGGRWQFRGNPSAGSGPQGHVTGEGLGTPGGMGQVFTGLGDRLGGKPFGGQGAVSLTHKIPGEEAMQARFRAGAQAAPSINPYSNVVADQTRPAQVALLSQMKAQMGGPSIAAMQGGKAAGQNLQAALAAGGGRPVMNQAAAVGGGLAADTGTGVLAEQLRAAGGLGGVAAGMRAGDLGVATASSNAGLEQRNLDEQMRQFYAGQGAKLTGMSGRFALEDEKFLARLKQMSRDQNEKEVDNYLSTVGTMAGGAM